MVELDEWFRIIADTVSEVFWISSGDRKQIFYVSPAYERIWGRSCQSLYDNPASWFDAIHPDDRARTAGTRDTSLPFEREYRIIAADGTVRHIWTRAHPVTDAKGVTFWVGSAQDITGRKRAEADAATMEERYRLAARATNDGLWDWDVTTGKAWWNDAMYEMQGLERTVVPSYEAWAARLHPEDHGRVTASFARTVADGGETWSEEYRLRWPDGSVREVYDRAYIASSEGKPVRMVGAVIDLTRRRALEAQLRHAQKLDAMGQLAGGIAHDFNNILQTILLELELLRSVRDLPERACDLADNLRDATERATRLTRQLLVFSRREVMRPQVIDLNVSILDIVKLLRRTIGEHITLQLELAPGELRVNVDPGMLDQVLLNLAVNARDAMPSGGTLAIETTRADAASGACACLVVRDTGSGIPAELLPRIFEPFFTTKEPGSGAGLGLATVFGIVKEHGGSIAVNSEVGAGTTFRTCFPLSDGELAETPVRPRRDSRGAETILVVEDDEHVRRGIRATLEESGYHVVEADRASVALRVVEDLPVDLVFTDLVMPGGMDGRQLVAQLASQRPRLKVILASGYNAVSGDLRYVQKPLTAERLLGIVRETLDS